MAQPPPPSIQQQPKTQLPISHSSPAPQSSQTNPADQPKPAPSFTTKKNRILALLAVPTEQYNDLSPKGSVDVNIRDLIDEINTRDGSVTTSSCGGRVSVFLEGRKDGGLLADEGERIEGVADENLGIEAGEIKEELLESEGERNEKGKETKARVGGKGGGGRWLFVSHDPVSLDGEKSLAELLGISRDENLEKEMSGKKVGELRFIHFKFEPMILHVLTSSPHQAQLLISAALQAGFRESGALNLTPPSNPSSNATSSSSATPIVAVRSMGLSLESIIGFLPCSSVPSSTETPLCIVPEWQLRNLLQIANQRFVENEKRIARFRTLLRELSVVKGEVKRKGQEGEVWEDAAARRARKKAEGLARRIEAVGKEVEGMENEIAVFGGLEGEEDPNS